MSGAGGMRLGVGVGLRAPHVPEVIATRPRVAWFEVHAENYMSGGPALRALETVRTDYPISVHGVGLSLGTAEGIDARHLQRLRRLVERIEPVLISEHLSWSTAGGVYVNHLLPLPYTEETLGIVCRHVTHVQESLGLTLLVENPSSYLRFRHSSIPESQFLAEMVARTGCGLLCDVNNIYVTGHNLDLDPVTYLNTLPAAAIGEIHLAGYSVNDADGVPVLIDDHGSSVSAAVWSLYAHARQRFGLQPTLIEWDTDLPTLSVLLGEAAKANDVGTHALPA